MLTCIACSKQLNTNGSLPQLPEGDGDAATPSTKQAIKTLTTQIKDMAVKASDAYKNCRPCSGSSGRELGQDYLDSDVRSISERFYGSYRRAGSSNSTPGLRRRDLDAKLRALSSGSATPASVSCRTESTIVFIEEDEPKEWVAQVEPGVLITFLSLPQGGNDLKRIRFSRDVFNKWQAQRWWTNNYDKIMELYNVRRFNRRDHEAPMPTPPRSEDESSTPETVDHSPMTPPLSTEHPPRHFHRATEAGHSSSESGERHGPSQPHHLHLPAGHFHRATEAGHSSSESGERHRPSQPHHLHLPAGFSSTHKLSSMSAARAEGSSVDASSWSSSSKDINRSRELSVSNASDLESEWVEQDVPGVYITIRALPGGGRELRRVRFSRERFGEMQARLWWDENRARIQQQYL